MALHFTLHVNGHSISHHVFIQRLRPKSRTPRADTVCTYRVETYAPHRALAAIAQFTHRYGDGPIECVRKALNAIHEQEAH